MLLFPRPRVSLVRGTMVKSMTDSLDWNMKIGYLPHSENCDGPSDRRRIGRITKELEKHGFEVCLYNPAKDLVDYDIVIISGLRNIGSIIEDRLRRKNTYFILDQSDALLLSAGPHLRSVSRVMRLIRVSACNFFLKKNFLGNLVELVKICDRIVVGSTLQKETLIKYNKNVTVISDILDEEYSLKKKESLSSESVRLVWEGFSENVLHFEVMRKALKELSSRYKIELLIYCNERIPKYFKHAGSIENYLSTLPCITKYHPWNKQTCADDLLNGNIAVIPIDLKNRFAAAKPANKLNAMRLLGIPVVATPTVAHKEAIIDGIDGFLSSDTTEWVNKISMLIEDSVLRARMGKAGRYRALEASSFNKIWPHWLKVFSSLSGRKEKLFPLQGQLVYA